MLRIGTRQSVILASVLVATLGLPAASFADDEVRGVIVSHGNDGTLTLQTDDGTSVVVVMSDSTKVRRDNTFGSTAMSSAVLIPGLHVRADGVFETPTRVNATRIEFKGDDLEAARAVQGGVALTEQRSLANEKQLQQHSQTLAQQAQTIGQHGAQIATAKDRIDIADQKIVATSGAIDATNARIANLDGYDVIRTLTVYFPNGKSTIEAKYLSELQELAAQAKDTRGGVIQVQGYASAVGPAVLNQELSAKRADAVTAVLQQNGISLTNVVVPAAMGTSEQVAPNNTSKGQAENRRTVVTLLQNKGIVGK